MSVAKALPANIKPATAIPAKIDFMLFSDLFYD
jgi:hypothetical protein